MEKTESQAPYFAATADCEKNITRRFAGNCYAVRDHELALAQDLHFPASSRRPIRSSRLGLSGTDAVMRAAIYARVSTLDQEPENQLQELRRYADARGGRRSSTSIGACPAQRTGGRRSINFLSTPGVDASTLSSVGALTAWVEA